MSVDTKAQVNAAVQLLKGVADPTRLKVLLHVQDGGKNVTEICDMLGMSQPAVSHHLSIMRLTGLLEATRTGRFVLYELTQKGSELAAFVTKFAV